MWYARKIGDWLFAKSNCTLLDYCKKFGYYPLACKIMALDETNERALKLAIARDEELKEHYIEFSKDQDAIRAKGNNRSWTQYFKDLITGWIMEDLVMEMLQKQGIDITLNGRDAHRKILKGCYIRQTADFLIRVGDTARRVELTCEFNHYLQDEGFVEKRAPALYKLWEAKGIWLYRDIPHEKYILVDFATEKVKLHLRHHNTSKQEWTKDVHRYILAENGKIERDDRLLAPEIISIVGCSIEGKQQPQLIEIEDEDSPPMTYAIGGVLKKNSQKKDTSVNEVRITKPKPEKKIVIEEKTDVKPPMPEIKEDVDEEDEFNNVNQGSEDIDFGDSDFV